jgi:cobalamin synthase
MLKSGPIISKVYFKNLNFLHAVLNTGALVVAAFIYYFSMDSEIVDSDEIPGYLTTVGIVLAFVGVFASAYIYKSKALSLQGKESLSDKLVEYRKASIVSWVVLDVAIVGNLVVYFLNQNELLLYIALFLVALMFLKRPSRRRCIDSLALGKKDEELIMNPDAVVTEY